MKAMRLPILLSLLGPVAFVAACHHAPPASVGLVVETTPPDASCSVSISDQAVAHVDHTPGVAMVPNVESDYAVTCARPGFKETKATVHVRAEKGATSGVGRLGGGGWVSVRLMPLQ
jgi:hypothetical protein